MTDKNQITPYPLRMPHELRTKLEAYAKEGNRSLHAELIARLEESLEAQPISSDQILAAVGEKIQQAIKPFAEFAILLSQKLPEVQKFLDENKELFDEEAKNNPDASFEDVFKIVQERLESDKNKG